jgi:hypothetical protein
MDFLRRCIAFISKLKDGEDADQGKSSELAIRTHVKRDVASTRFPCNSRLPTVGSGADFSNGGET